MSRDPRFRDDRFMRAHVTRQVDRAVESCAVCDGSPRVLVVVDHPTSRRFIAELLAREHGCWTTVSLDDRRALADRLASDPPDLLIIEAGDFPLCCRESLRSFPTDRVVVIGPEPDAAYQHAALDGGAGAWLARDDVGADLSSEMRHALGCSHGPCPPKTSRRDHAPSSLSREP